MSFTLDAYAALRPYVYHLTARANLDHLSADPRLLTAATLLQAAGRPELIRKKRREMLPVTIGDRTFILRDQIPLQEGNAILLDGWNFDDFLEALNRRIYLWPGTDNGPIQSGRDHFKNYARSTHPHTSTILRIPFRSLLNTNSDLAPHFSRYNFGSPRRYYGEPSPRGPRTCAPADTCLDLPRKIVEVTFLDDIILPPDTDTLPLTPETVVDNRLVGNWTRLRDPAP